MTDYTYPGGQNCQGVTVDHINYLYDRSVDNIKHMVEIAKLQYDASVTDINHDYAVVDVFTDSTGYNNTVCTADTTSTYCGTGLSGYYISLVVLTGKITQCTLTCCAAGTGSVNIGDYYLQTNSSGAGGTDVACGRICCNSIDFNINDYCCVSFNVLCQRSYNGPSAPQMCWCWNVSNSHDNVSAQGHDGYNPCTTTINNSYSYNKVSENCFDFYCNGSCKCQVNITTFPNITLCSCILYSNSTGSGYVKLCLYNLNLHTDVNPTSIILNETKYARPISSIYLTDEHTGSGTVVYNIINATTSNCIATAVPLNCLYPLTCCVCCHIYEIIQCNDGVSCIKSYALIAGED